MYWSYTVVGWDDWLDVDAEMEDETIFTIPRQSTPIVEFDEGLTPSQRTTEIAKRFFERNSLITRPLRTLAGRIRNRMVIENIPSDIEMSDLIIQDKSLDEVSVEILAETNIDTEIDTDVSQTALKVPLGGPHPEIGDTFTVILPTEENGIPSFIASIPKTLARSASNMIRNYARRFGLSITKHKYFLIFLSAVTGVSLAYSLTGRSKRHIIISIAD